MKLETRVPTKTAQSPLRPRKPPQNLVMKEKHLLPKVAGIAFEELPLFLLTLVWYRQARRDVS